MGLEDEIKSWLSEREKRYLSVLREVGLKSNVGFQKLVGGRVVYDQTGEFTGSGLCHLSSGVIEIAVHKKFGRCVVTNGVQVVGIRRGFNYSGSFTHVILTAKEPTETFHGINIDATYKQMEFNTPARIYISDLGDQERIYGRQIKTYSEHALAYEAQGYFGDRLFNGLTMDDVQDLVHALE